MKAFSLILFLFSFQGYNANCQARFEKVDYKKVLKFNENYFTFSKPWEIVILGERRKLFSAPLTINGRKIYNTYSSIQIKQPNFGSDFSEYILREIKKELELLPDGHYTLHRMFLVVDKTGKLAYFDFDTLKATNGSFKQINTEIETTSNNPISAIQNIIDQIGLRDAPKMPSTFVEPIVSKEIKLKIYYSLYKALKNCPKFTPAKQNGKPIDFILEDGMFDMYSIKNHKVTLIKLTGKKSDK